MCMPTSSAGSTMAESIQLLDDMEANEWITNCYSLVLGGGSNIIHQEWLNRLVIKKWDQRNKISGQMKTTFTCRQSRC